MDTVKEMRRYGDILMYDEIIDEHHNHIRIEVIKYMCNLWYVTSCNGRVTQKCELI